MQFDLNNYNAHVESIQTSLNFRVLLKSFYFRKTSKHIKEQGCKNEIIYSLFAFDYGLICPGINCRLFKRYFVYDRRQLHDYCRNKTKHAMFASLALITHTKLWIKNRSLKLINS